MRVGIDIQSTQGLKTGIGYYTRNLIGQFDSSKDLQLFYYKHPKQSDLNTLERIYWENMTLATKAGKDKVDLLHIPGFAGPRKNVSYKKITTTHDLIGLIYPQNLGLVSRYYWQKWLPSCIKNSDFIIADSENTKNDITRLLHIAADKIKVIYLAVDPRFRQRQSPDKHESLRAYGIDKRYVLSVGTIEPRKNIINLIDAFDRYLKESGDGDILLVIAGKKGWDYDRCSKKTLDLNLRERIIFCDYVRDEDLPMLYNASEVFVYPSFYEGFGLPVLEAMSCGTPVICSSISSLPEIGGDAPLYVNPNSVDSIAAALLRVVNNKELKAMMSKKSLENSKRFSWEKTATETIHVYKEAIG